ncbi:hypothetical protein [Rhodoferax sp.]|jgi:predicted lipoprotein with Yx(FWY)xxD motif|uniref:hypothetical protein n=1 Tax=Rhodoferax sp. TaxID=50421 RepID=UPI0037850BDF
MSLAVASAASLRARPTFIDGLLVDEKGITLYAFDKDGGAQSNCKDVCLMQ